MVGGYENKNESMQHRIRRACFDDERKGRRHGGTLRERRACQDKQKAPSVMQPNHKYKARHITAQWFRNVASGTFGNKENYTYISQDLF